MRCGLNYTTSTDVIIQMAAIRFVGQVSTRSIRARCLCEIFNLQSPLENVDLIFRPGYKHENNKLAFFYVLLTLHLSIFILVINQLDAQNFLLQ